MTFTWKSMFPLAWGQTTPGPPPSGGPERWVREGEGGAEGGSRHATPSPRVLFSSSLRLSQRFLSSWARMACGTVVSPAFLSHSLCPGRVGGGQCPLALQPRTCISKQLHTHTHTHTHRVGLAAAPRTSHVAPGIAGADPGPGPTTGVRPGSRRCPVKGRALSPGRHASQSPFPLSAVGPRGRSPGLSSPTWRG